MLVEKVKTRDKVMNERDLVSLQEAEDPYHFINNPDNPNATLISVDILWDKSEYNT